MLHSKVLFSSFVLLVSNLYFESVAFGDNMFAMLFEQGDIPQVRDSVVIVPSSTDRDTHTRAELVYGQEFSRR